MEGLDFLKPMGEQQKKIIAQNDELADLIKQYLKKPLPAPVIEIDYEQLAKHVTNLMGDPAGLINQANSELSANLNGFVATARAVPKSVSIRGDYYGFTSWKPCAAYCLTLLSFAGMAAYSWHYNSDSEVVKRLHRDRTIINAEMAVFKKNNPVLTDKYFPEYMNVWDETKLLWKKVTDL
jgi:hypothetical protein